MNYLYRLLVIVKEALFPTSVRNIPMVLRTTETSTRSRKPPLIAGEPRQPVDRESFLINRIRGPPVPDLVRT